MNVGQCAAEVFGEHWNQLDKDLLALIALDFHGILRNEISIDEHQAAVLLRTRIGGANQLYGYANILSAWVNSKQPILFDTSIDQTQGEKNV